MGRAAPKGGWKGNQRIPGSLWSRLNLGCASRSHPSQFLIDPELWGKGKASELSHLLSSDEMVSIFRSLVLSWTNEPMWAFEVACSSFRGNTRPKVLGHIYVV